MKITHIGRGAPTLPPVDQVQLDLDAYDLLVVIVALGALDVASARNALEDLVHEKAHPMAAGLTPGGVSVGAGALYAQLVDDVLKAEGWSDGV